MHNYSNPNADLSSNSSLKLRGILLPFTTPFTKDEALDLPALRSNLRLWNRTGITGYVALGSTGERVNLSEREYLEVVETSRREVPSELTFIVGVGQQSTSQTIREIRQVTELGADAVLAITPSFYRPAITQSVLIEHYRAIADAVTVPIILYSMPDLTGVVIEPNTAAELSMHANIIGMKDSSADLARFVETMKAVPDGFSLLTGNGTVLCDALRAGSAGGILAVGCVAFAACLEIYRAVTAGNHDRAVLLQQKLTPLALAVTKRYGIGGLKAAMDQVGFTGGSVRAPLKAVHLSAREEIAALLRDVLSDEQTKHAVMQEQ